MAIKDNREYRFLGAFEVEERAETDPDFTVRGYASTFDEYKLFTWDGIDYHERIDRHAFDETDMSDVVFLLDHEGRVYARTKNNTVHLSVDDHGLFQETDLGKTEASRGVYEDIRVGNYSQMSFAFTVSEDHFEDREDGGPTRVIDRIAKLYDVSAVSFPANPNTDIGISARSLFDGEIEKREAERLRAEKIQRDKAKLALKLKLMEE